MINIEKYDDGYPVSVIIPHKVTPIRDKFFKDFCYPSIEGMLPNEIIINTDDGGAPKKRNDGFKKSTQKYVLFSDNDIIFPSSFLEKAIDVLEKNPDKGYAYGGYFGIVQDKINHPIKTNFRISTRPFDGRVLKRENYISTMSLIRSDIFPMFDESLKRLQDWDIWLTLLKQGIEGIAVQDIEFFAYYLDEGITSNTNNERENLLKIINKHKLGSW